MALWWFKRASNCNSVGEYIVGGSTDLADTTRNGVIAMNGERVLMREGDPVDLNGGRRYV